jgi:hypothetical protein
VKIFATAEKIFAIAVCSRRWMQELRVCRGPVAQSKECVAAQRDKANKCIGQKVGQKVGPKGQVRKAKVSRCVSQKAQDQARAPGVAVSRSQAVVVGLEAAAEAGSVDKK